jgi:hypothetical protein
MILFPDEDWNNLGQGGQPARDLSESFARRVFAQRLRRARLVSP